ncbi:mitochondrial nucleoid-associated protein 1 isoform X1 [Dipodomys merriami]|uniref:mitochondrial nucleoid-associated protein 1 isoform X1 n=1 Tax=Dipodomys merriami TaxID=94247 RepID=UPI00385579CE
MEVCPYCKKPFKRLKSHLPYCKMIELTIPADQKVHQSRPATVPCVKKVERPTKDLTKRKELEIEDEKRNTKSINNKLERTVASFPLQDTNLQRASTPKVGVDIKAQSHLSFRVLKYTKPKITFRRKTKAQSYPSINSSPKQELAKGLPKSEEIQSNSLETEVSLPSSSTEPSLSNQGRKYSLAAPNDVQANPMHVKLDTIEPQRQGLLVKSLTVHTSDCHHSLKNLNDGIQTVRASMLNKSDSRDRSYVPAHSADIGNPEAQGKNSESLVLGPHLNPLNPISVENQVVGLGCGVEVRRAQGNAEDSMLVTDLQERASVSGGCKNFTGSSATKEKQQDGDSLLNLFSLREATYNEFLCVSPSNHQNLASLSMKGLQGEKVQVCGHNQVPNVKLLLEGQVLPALEPYSACHHQALHQQSTQYISKSSLVSHIAVDRKPPPSPMGLEWFPDLYPGYVELGVLPRKPRFWNSVAQRPQLASPLGGHLSQVLLLERSSAGVKSLEPPTGLTTSNFPVTRLLGALHKGWIMCNTTIKKSRVGGITMLFTGYFLLGCSWSFKHLKLQRWRK